MAEFRHSHFRVKCRGCGAIVSACRCFEDGKTATQYVNRCPECPQKPKPEGKAP